MLLAGYIVGTTVWLVRTRAPIESIAVVTAMGLLGVGGVLFSSSRQGLMMRRLDTQTLRANAESATVRSLQEALAQQPLPVTPNLAFSASYRPASIGALVGGDWYDAFELPHGRILFLIGDVAGHGVEAAVAMTRIRQAILSAALHDSDPGAILARANAMIELTDKFATAICGQINSATLEVVYATAGHPQAMLIDPEGSPELLSYDGPPLGVVRDAVYPSFTLQVKSGSLLVLYTDGLLEYDHDVIKGELRLLDIARRVARERRPDPATAIHDAIFRSSAPQDDVAIMTVAFRELDPALQNTKDWSVDVRGIRKTFNR